MSFVASAAQALYFHLREDLAVPHVVLRIWGRPLDDGIPEASPVDSGLRDKAETMGAPQCGAAAGNAFVTLFREAQEHIRSVALIPLGQTRTIGLLALGSEDPQRFYAGMGTLYLRRIGELAAGALAART